VGTGIGTLSGGSTSCAIGISSNGQYVVGYAYDGSGQQRAVRWTKIGATWTIQDLNSLLSPGSVWLLQRANSANDTGWIVGLGTRDDETTHAFLLTEHDAQAPSTPTNVHSTGRTPRAISIAWNASTDNAAVAGYRVYRNGGQVGTFATTSYTYSNLQQATTYSYTVSAYDGAGYNSAQSSPPAVETTLAGISVKAAKDMPDGASIGFASKVISAVFNGYFYVEETDRFSGIKVVPVVMPGDIAVGATVDVGGTLRTANGERYLDGATCQAVP
jgi:hypothetical protein